MLLGSCVAAACGELIAEAPADPGDAGGVDAGVGDAVAEVGDDVEDAGFDGVIYSQGFEGLLPCDSWAPTLLDVASATPARSGQAACRICPTDTNGGYLYRSLRVGRGAGHYAITAYVRGTVDPPPPAATWGMRLQGAPRDGGLFYTNVDVTGAHDGGYAPAFAEFRTDAGVENVRITFFTAPGDMGCTLIDDITVTYDP